MTIEIKHLRTLLGLKQSGSLAAAAERLYVTQSALSHQLKDLENKLEGSLFERKSSPLRFTEKGWLLLMLAERVLPQIDLVEAQLRQAQATPRWRFAIDCHACYHWLEPLFAEMEQGMAVELDVCVRYQFDALEKLKGGELEVVLSAEPDPAAGYHFLPLGTFATVLLVANDHPWAGQACVEAAQLAHEVLITYPVAPERLDIFRDYLDAAGVVPRQVKHCELPAIQLNKVAQRQGVVALPSWLAGRLKQPALLCLPMAQPVERTLYLCCQSALVGTVALEQFKGRLIDTLGL